MRRSTTMIASFLAIATSQLTGEISSNCPPINQAISEAFAVVWFTLMTIRIPRWVAAQWPVEAPNFQVAFTRMFASQRPVGWRLDVVGLVVSVSSQLSGGTSNGEH